MCQWATIRLSTSVHAYVISSNYAHIQSANMDCTPIITYLGPLFFVSIRTISPVIINSFSLSKRAYLIYFPKSSANKIFFQFSYKIVCILIHIFLLTSTYSQNWNFPLYSRSSFPHKPRPCLPLIFSATLIFNYHICTSMSLINAFLHAYNSRQIFCKKVFIHTHP